MHVHSMVSCLFSRIEVNPKLGSKVMDPVIDEMKATKLSDDASQQSNSNKSETSFSQPAWSNRRHSTQSRTFLLLQSMLDGGEGWSLHISPISDDNK